MTYLQTVMFVVQRNALNKIAQYKCSAKDSLRKVVLNLKAIMRATKYFKIDAIKLAMLDNIGQSFLNSRFLNT